MLHLSLAQTPTSFFSDRSLLCALARTLAHSGAQVATSLAAAVTLRLHAAGPQGQPGPRELDPALLASGAPRSTSGQSSRALLSLNNEANIATVASALLSQR